MSSDFICTKQAAKEFGLSAAWFERERWKGTGPEYIKLQGRVLYSRSHLKEWFLKHKVTPSPQNKKG